MIQSKRSFVISVLSLVLLLFSVFAFAGNEHPAKGEHPAKKAPTVEEQLHGLQTMCTETAKDMAERQEKKPLYDRLGGYDRILELTTEIVRLHSINPEIKRTLEGVDYDMLAKHVADFMAAGTGGTAEYTGRSMPDAHEHLKLSDADFMSAGGDVVKAMTTLKYGENEINEVVCILVSLKDQVVLK